MKSDDLVGGLSKTTCCASLCDSDSLLLLSCSVSSLIVNICKRQNAPLGRMQNDILFYEKETLKRVSRLSCQLGWHIAALVKNSPDKVTATC